MINIQPTEDSLLCRQIRTVVVAVWNIAAKDVVNFK